jgi:D-alanyl-D-alanine carboxypeptidase
MNPRLVSLNSALGISSELIVAHGLSVCEEASSLEIAEVGADGRDHRLIAAAAEAWRNLKIAAHNDGVELFIVSAFRSIDRQTEIIRRKIEAGLAVEEILTVSAPPGFSEHHTGRAIDITTPGCRALEIEFDQTAAFAWLNARAAEFGYYLSYPIGNHFGYQYEPWHWCFNDAQPNAQEGLAMPTA